MEPKDTNINLREKRLFQGHELTFYVQDSSLHVELEALGLSCKYYKGEINENQIKSMTFFFSDAGSIYRLMIDALSGNFPKTRLVFTDDRKLSYNSELEVGSQKIMVSFSIECHEVQLDPTTVLESKVKKLYKFNEEQLMKNERYENDLREMKNTVAEQGNKIERLEQKIQELEGLVREKSKAVVIEEMKKFRFDSNSVNKDSFIFSNDNKTITMSIQDEGKNIFMSEPIPKNKKSEIRFKILQHTNRWFMIGIAKSSLKNDISSLNSKQGFYGIHPANWYLYPEGLSTSFQDTLEVGSEISIEVDMNDGNVIWKYNNKQIFTKSISSELENEWYFAVDFCSKDSSLEIKD